MAPYVPRTAIDTVLHGVVREHLETFLAAAAARTNGVGLPFFIGYDLCAESSLMQQRGLLHHHRVIAEDVVCGRGDDGKDLYSRKRDTRRCQRV